VEDDNEEIIEVELSFNTRKDVLRTLGITEDEVCAAIVEAMDRREKLVDQHDVNDDEIPPLEDMQLVIHGIVYRAEELCEIDIRGDFEDGHNPAAF
jgi:hypothetical protein